MGKEEIVKIAYDERTDDEKLESNWRKARNLFGRKDWSASVLRAATAAEISANIYVRQFLLTEYNIPKSYVDALLVSANGLDGKFKRLIKPAAEFRKTWSGLKHVQKRIESLHEHRNGVVHSGKFKSEMDARSAFESSLAIIKALAPNESKKLALPYESA